MAASAAASVAPLVPALAGRHLSLPEILEYVRLPICESRSTCTYCDLYIVTMDVTTWNGETFYFEIGEFYSSACIYTVLRQFRYFLPDAPIRIKFSV